MMSLPLPAFRVLIVLFVTVILSSPLPASRVVTFAFDAMIVSLPLPAFRVSTSLFTLIVSSPSPVSRVVIALSTVKVSLLLPFITTSAAPARSFVFRVLSLILESLRFRLIAYRLEIEPMSEPVRVPFSAVPLTVRFKVSL